MTGSMYSHSPAYPHRQQHQHYHNDAAPSSYHSQQARGYGQEYAQGTPRSYADDGAGASNMAGFGARKFAQKQEEARRRAERERWMAEEQKAMQAAEEQRYYEQQRVEREEQSRWEEEERMYREAEEDDRRQREYQEWSRKQEEAQQQRAVTPSLSPLSRSVPLSNGATAWTVPRQITQRSATFDTVASSDRHGAHKAQGSHKQSASASTVASATSRARHHLLRATVYKGGHDERAERNSGGGAMESDGFGGMKVKNAPDSSSGTGPGSKERPKDWDIPSRQDGPSRQEAPSRQDSPSSQEGLPQAKCADCGDSLPFEELVDHMCLSLAECKSPLFARSVTGTPVLESPLEASGGSRSPFLEKYDEYKSSSSLLGVPPRSATSPAKQDAEWANDESARHRANTAPLKSSSSSDATVQEVERLRLERKRQIEEQRAAKRMQMAAPQQPAPTPVVRSHHREPNSVSSISTASSGKSSLLEQSSSMRHQAPHSADLTPSSSYESWNPPGKEEKKAPEREDRPAQKTTAMPKKSQLDLAGIEDLMNDIHKQDSPRAKGDRLAHKASRRPLALQLPSQGHNRAVKKCSVCLHTFAKRQPMVEKDGKIFCIDDYAELYLEKCRKCSRPVRDVGVRSKDGALSGIYHRDCLSCFRCNAAFEDRAFYVFDNAPYCAKHYHQLNGSTCHSCKEGIEGKCRQVETGERFHSRCLTCQFDNGKEFCKDVLTDYYLVKGKRLCEWHFEKIAKYLDVAKAAKAAKRRTFVQTVEARKGKA